MTTSATTDLTDRELTLSEACVALNRSEASVRRLIHAGKLRAVRRLGRLFVIAADVELLRQGEPVQPTAAAG